VKKKKLPFFLITAVMFGFIVTACPIEFSSDIEPNEVPWGNSAFSQTLAASSWGWGGTLTVEIEFVNGFIETVNIRHNETTGHGARLISRAIPLIIQANYFEIDVITRSSNVVTANALLDAWSQIQARFPTND